MENLFHEAAKILVMVLLSVAGFAGFIIVIALVCQVTGKILFGQRFEDWWDRTFWF